MKTLCREDEIRFLREVKELITQPLRFPIDEDLKTPLRRAQGKLAYLIDWKQREADKP